MGGFGLCEAEISLFLHRQANGRVINHSLFFILQKALPRASVQYCIIE